MLLADAHLGDGAELELLARDELGEKDRVIALLLHDLDHVWLLGLQVI